MRRLALCLALLVLSSCAPPPVVVHVHVEASPDANFSAARTYAWLTEKVRQQGDSLDFGVRNHIDEQLISKGYIKQAGGADLLVDDHIVQREKTTDSFKDFLAYRESGGQADIQEAYVVGYAEGSLVVDIYDGHTQQLIWRGTGTAVLNPDSQSEKLQESIQRMFNQFPSRSYPSQP